MSTRDRRCPAFFHQHCLLAPRASEVLHFALGAWLAGVVLLVAISPNVCADTLVANVKQIDATEQNQAVVIAVGEQHAEPSCSYVITHGMGGTKVNDRFHRLAETIRQVQPRANIYLVDWTEASNQRLYGINLPFLVARSIDRVAADVARQLQRYAVDPAQVTMIGESFGNYVNHQAAKHLGGVDRLLAFNPASELGGYSPPDLGEYSKVAWAFHTRSPFDTARRISDRTVLLKTTFDDPLKQHTFGVQWLRQRLLEDDRIWLTGDRMIPPGPEKMYDLVLEADGTPDWEWAARVPSRATLETSAGRDLREDSSDVAHADHHTGESDTMP